MSHATHASPSSVGAPARTATERAPSPRARLLGAAALALVAGGCGGGGGGGSGEHGHVAVVEHLFESEPNDHAWSADFFGALRPGDRLVVHGCVDDLGPDLRDGFAFVSAAPAHVEFALRALDGADLDLCVYDAVTDEIVLCFESPYDPERGGFDLHGGGGELHLLVSSFAGSSHYELEIAVSSPGGVAAATHAAPERGARERVAPYLRAPRAAGPIEGEDDDDRAPLLHGLAVTLEPDGRILRRAFAIDAAGRLVPAR